MKSTVKYLILFILVSSCTKFGKNISIEGRVMNPITNEGISGVELRLLKTSFGLPGGIKVVKSIKTDDNGYFKLDKLSLRAERFQMYSLNGEYYQIGWTSDNGENFSTDLSVTKGKKQKADFWAVPYGNLILDITNVNCLGPNDSIQFTRKYQFDEDYNGYSSYRTGCYDYVSPEPFQLPMGYHYYKTKVTRNGITTYVYDTVYVSPSSVSTCVIDY